MERATSSLIRALEARDELSAEDRRLVSELPIRLKSYRRGEEIAPQFSKPSFACVVATGYAARVHLTPDGGRQITALHLQGDPIDLHGLLLNTLDHSIVAITDCEIAQIPHARLLDAFRISPHLQRMMWTMTAVDAAIHRAWLVSLGQRQGKERIAHMFCEFMLRSQVAGIARGRSFPLPISQHQLGEVLGQSAVHVNRTVQALRHDGLVEWKSGIVIVSDFDRLASSCGFDPTYLNIGRDPAGRSWLSRLITAEG